MNRIIETIKSVWKELMTGTPYTATPYDRGSQAVWHAVLGSALFSILGSFWIILVLYACKELYDWYNLADLRDCIEDICSVMYGAFIATSVFWSFWLLGLGAFVFLIHQFFNYGR